MKNPKGKTDEFDIAVVGAGLSGLIAAIASARRGHDVCLIAPASLEPDGRTTALLSDSIEFLREAGLWDVIFTRAYPLRTMRIIDGTNRLFRAPQADFRCSEIDLEAFGYNLENREIAGIFRDVAASLDNITLMEAMATGLSANNAGTSHAVVTDKGGTVRASVILAADGRKSVLRQSLGISMREWSYPQVAVVANLSHSLDHHDTSTEFHTETGPFTLVPLGTKRSSLVWVENPDNAQRLVSMQPDQLAEVLEERMQSILGKLQVISPVGRFPLSSAIASRFGKDNVMLIGEAGHAFPPIGAQGLNLGIRDIREAIRQVAQSGHATAGERYHARRFADVATRTASVDLLNRSLLSDFLPVQAARSLGLYVLGSSGPLRRVMMREGVMPGMGLSGLGRRLTAPRSASGTKTR